MAPRPTITMAPRLGNVSLQAQGSLDVFAVIPVWENGVEPSDEMLLNVSDAQFESDHAWVTGKVPQMNLVNVDGDTATLQAWFKGEVFDSPFTIRVYVEFELAEELIAVEKDLTEEEKQAAKDAQPQEIII